MKNKSIKILATIFSLTILIAPMFVLAQIKNPLGDITITGFIKKVLDYIVKIGAVVAVFAFIWAGFLYVKAQGNESELTKAKDIFINTCIGTAVLLGAQLIGTIIKGTVDSLSK